MENRHLGPERERELREAFGRVRFAALLGMSIESVAAGHCVLALPMRDDLKQRTGLMHGGVVATLVDSAVAFALYGLVAPGEEILTVELKTNFLSPVRDGDIARAEARILKKGRSIAVGEVDVWSRAGERCAKGLATYLILDAKGSTSTSAAGS